MGVVTNDAKTVALPLAEGEISMLAGVWAGVAERGGGVIVEEEHAAMVVKTKGA